MEKWLVKRPADEVVVTILKNKSDGTYSFVNLTKEHICPCRFPSMDDAIHDMDAKITTGEIISYQEQTDFFMPKYKELNMVENYKVITLCGSTKFEEEFKKVQRSLTLQGVIVISVGLFSHTEENSIEWENDGIKAMLDDIHKRKIDMADEIFVINKDGYIGESTRSEIEYAKSKGIPIRYLEDIKE